MANTPEAKCLANGGNVITFQPTAVRPCDPKTTHHVLALRRGANKAGGRAANIAPFAALRRSSVPFVTNRAFARPTRTPRSANTVFTTRVWTDGPLPPSHPNCIVLCVVTCWTTTRFSNIRHRLRRPYPSILSWPCTKTRRFRCCNGTEWCARTFGDCTPISRNVAHISLVSNRRPKRWNRSPLCR